MGTDHIQRLEQARKTLVDRRRTLAGSLAAGKEQIESEAERLMKIQGAIEAVDRAQRTRKGSRRENPATRSV